MPRGKRLVARAGLAPAAGTRYIGADP